MMKKLLPAVLPLVLLALWWAVTHFGNVPALLLPSPEQVGRRFVQLLVSGELLQHAGTSMLRVFTGFLISSSVALVLAFVVSRNDVVERSLSLVLEALRVIPPLSLVPLLILWLGIDEAPKLAIVVLASFFPVYLSALSATRSVSGAYRDLARVLGLSEREMVKHILLPGAAPGILTGLRLGFGYAWRALVGSELIAAAAGLGYLIEDASALARTDVVIVGILTIAVLGILCDAFFQRIARRFTPGAQRKAGRSARAVSERADAHSAETESGAPAGAGAEPGKLPGIEIKDLTVTYPGLAKPPIDGLSLSVAAGCITAILGRSGCGKTTLLKTVAGLLEARSGSIRFTGEAGKSPRLSMVFQEPTLLPWKTVRENVALALVGKMGEQALTHAKVAEAIRLVGLEGLAERYPDELSGGQQQRAGFARALAADPEVLLMDEPFGALDALTRQELQDESIRVFSQRQMTVLMITHDVREAVRMADAAVILDPQGGCERFEVDLPRPRRLSSPGVAELEERILDLLMRR
ncbi:ATP-binding cassette domain-containing protein [Sutterella sp.]|uniref:ATP-binding cassette domain-containing protein n=1 Tax=Sutterella sp. TaxID=1981025 RepID=UPI0026DEFA97|nr:ATP-binding cassette domain-containing protein [Sutterella sp.]MDO5531110.1 ATP-binding cassette domain-containing protein [Sutterella sp.]